MAFLREKNKTQIQERDELIVHEKEELTQTKKQNNDGYVSISGFKGIWTLDEVVKLLQDLDFKVRITMSTKEEDLLISRDESSNLVEGEVI